MKNYKLVMISFVSFKSYGSLSSNAVWIFGVGVEQAYRIVAEKSVAKISCSECACMLRVHVAGKKRSEHSSDSAFFTASI